MSTSYFGSANTLSSSVGGTNIPQQSKRTKETARTRFEYDMQSIDSQANQGKNLIADMKGAAAMDAQTAQHDLQQWAKLWPGLESLYKEAVVKPARKRIHEKHAEGSNLYYQNGNSIKDVIEDQRSLGTLQDAGMYSQKMADAIYTKLSAEGNVNARKIADQWSAMGDAGKNGFWLTSMRSESKNYGLGAIQRREEYEKENGVMDADTRLQWYRQDLTEWSSPKSGRNPQGFRQSIVNEYLLKEPNQWIQKQNLKEWENETIGASQEYIKNHYNDIQTKLQGTDKKAGKDLYLQSYPALTYHYKKLEQHGRLGGKSWKEALLDDFSQAGKDIIQATPSGKARTAVAAALEEAIQQTHITQTEIDPKDGSIISTKDVRVMPSTGLSLSKAQPLRFQTGAFANYAAGLNNADYDQSVKNSRVQIGIINEEVQSPEWRHPKLNLSWKDLRKEDRREYLEEAIADLPHKYDKSIKTAIEDAVEGVDSTLTFAQAEDLVATQRGLHGRHIPKHLLENVSSKDLADLQEKYDFKVVDGKGLLQNSKIEQGLLSNLNSTLKSRIGNNQYLGINFKDWAPERKNAYRYAEQKRDLRAQEIIDAAPEGEKPTQAAAMMQANQEIETQIEAERMVVGAEFQFSTDGYKQIKEKISQNAWPMGGQYANESYRGRWSSYKPVVGITSHYVNTFGETKAREILVKSFDPNTLGRPPEIKTGGYTGEQKMVTKLLGYPTVADMINDMNQRQDPNYEKPPEQDLVSNALGLCNIYALNTQNNLGGAANRQVTRTLASRGGAQDRVFVTNFFEV